MSVCLVLGGAECLYDDVDRYSGPVDGAVACNDAIWAYDGDLTAVATLHAINYFEGPQWLEKRRERDLSPPAALYTHNRMQVGEDMGVIETQLEFPGQRKGFSGSSGLLAAKVALMDLEFDEVVLCGVPMSPMRHVDGADNWLLVGRKSRSADFFRAWEQVNPEFLARMRSMSGRTRDFLGAPEIPAYPASRSLCGCGPGTSQHRRT